MTPALIAAVDAMFDRFADTTEGGWMGQRGVDTWLVAINKVLGRGSEYRNALKAMAEAGAAEGAAEGGGEGEGCLSRNAFHRIYQSEIKEGKFWGVASDLWSTGCGAGCLPPVPTAVADVEGKLGVWGEGEAETSTLAAALGTPFTSRFDQIWYSTERLHLVSVRQPCDPIRARRPFVLPNVWSGSDHLPIAATFHLTP